MQFLSSLFGEKTLIFLAVVLALIVFAVLATMLVRAIGDRAGRSLGGRTRQQRLGVVDAFDLDRQRQLVIVRRDNVEHLVMIGGPNDVVIESAIVRQASASAPLGARESYGPAAAGPPLAARQGAAGLEGRSEFEPPAQEPALPVSPGYAPARAPAAVSAPPPAAGPRFPFPPQRAAPTPTPTSTPPTPTPAPVPAAAPAVQRAPPREVTRLYPAQAAPAPPIREPAAVAPPPAPPPHEPATAPPPPVLSGEAPPPAAGAPGLRPPPRPGPSPRPPRPPFPTLRQGGGPLFPVRSASATRPGEAGQPSPAEGGAPKNEMIESFESLEEEMAKLLGRPGSGER